MKRAFGSFLTSVSLSLLAVIIGIWIWSYPGTTVMRVKTRWPRSNHPQIVQTEIKFERGRIMVFREVATCNDTTEYAVEMSGYPVEERGIVWERGPYYGALQGTLPFGIAYGSGPSSLGQPLPIPTFTRSAIVSLWLPAILLAALPALSIRLAWRHHRRARPGVCLNCGYDVRFSKDRCSECGTAITIHAVGTNPFRLIPAAAGLATTATICMAIGWIYHRVNTREHAFWTQLDKDQRLMQAVENDDVQAATTALNDGANPNAFNWEERYTAIKFAIGRLHEGDLVRLLLDRGASASGSPDDSIYNCPLDNAVQESHIDTVQLLLSRGADPNTSHVPRPILNGILASDFETERLMVPELLHAGANPNLRDADGNAALHQIIIGPSYYSEFLDMLLRAGADPNLKNKAGDDVLHLALQRKQFLDVFRRHTPSHRYPQ